MTWSVNVDSDSVSRLGLVGLFGLKGLDMVRVGLLGDMGGSGLVVLAVEVVAVSLVVLEDCNFRPLGIRRNGALLVRPGVVGQACRPMVPRFLTGDVLASSDRLIRMGTAF